MSRIMAYMSPADELFPTLTVRETLSYEADMLLPGSIQDAERNELVEQVLDDLGMRSCIDTKGLFAFLLHFCVYVFGLIILALSALPEN